LSVGTPRSFIFYSTPGGVTAVLSS